MCKAQSRCWGNLHIHAHIMVGLQWLELSRPHHDREDTKHTATATALVCLIPSAHLFSFLPAEEQPQQKHCQEGSCHDYPCKLQVLPSVGGEQGYLHIVSRISALQACVIPKTVLMWLDIPVDTLRTCMGAHVLAVAVGLSFLRRRSLSFVSTWKVPTPLKDTC